MIERRSLFVPLLMLALSFGNAGSFSAPPPPEPPPPEGWRVVLIVESRGGVPDLTRRYFEESLVVDLVAASCPIALVEPEAEHDLELVVRLGHFKERDQVDLKAKETGGGEEIQQVRTHTTVVDFEALVRRPKSTEALGQTKGHARVQANDELLVNPEPTAQARTVTQIDVADRITKFLCKTIKKLDKRGVPRKN